MDRLTNADVDLLEDWSRFHCSGRRLEMILQALELAREALPCEHEGKVFAGRCDSCGETGLDSDAETYARENAR